MPAKKKSAKSKSAKKEVLPDPSTLKSGVSTVFVGGWSSYSTIESVSGVSRSVIGANTGADGVVAAPLPRTNVLVLPTEDDSDDNECTEAQAPSVIEVADQMFIEGVSRRQCAQAQSLVKTWAPVSVAPAATADPIDESLVPKPTEEPINPYADALTNEMYAQTVSVGASYVARDVVLRCRCSVEGVAPNIVVPPQLPAKPNLDAVTLDPSPDSGGAENKSVSAARKKKASAKKKKPKLTPEQLEELDRKKAALEAEYMSQTEEAVRRAKEEADYLMTFAHPSRWAHVVFRHMTFAGPVEVYRAHVEFQNCRFIGSPNDGMSDRPLLLVTQYCQVKCVKCSFEVPPRCGIYALPSAQIEVRKCLFTGVTQDVLWAAAVPGVSPKISGATSSEADAGNHDDGDDDGAGTSRIPSLGMPLSLHEADKKGDGALSCRLVLAGGLQEATREALAHRAAAVGILTDCAKLLLQGSDFLCLGIGVYIKGSYSAYISHNRVAPKAAKQLTQEACDTYLDSNTFHHFANAALVLDKSARFVSIRRNYIEASAHYGLDCQSGVNSVLLQQNYFATDALVRVREGANVSMLHNDFQSIPLNDNSCENPCLQMAY